MKNTELHNAKKNKADEFYTRYNDISDELQFYTDEFKDKVVYCNCDNPYESNFFMYFALNFNYLGLKKLIATSYVTSPIIYTQLTLEELMDSHKTEINRDELLKRVNENEKPPYKIEINEIIENPEGGYYIPEVENLVKNKKNVLTWLKGDGDFRSEECKKILQEADIVVTNPPFSLFIEYIAQLIEFNKKFIVIGNTNALTYKETFKLIKENKLRTGYTNFNVGMYFFVPDYYEKYHKIEEGRKMVRVASTCWFTNLDVKRHHELLYSYKQYTPEAFPHYDNYDAIEVSKVVEIPEDWEGIIGVPITFFDKYNPTQFEIIGLAASAGYDPDVVGIEKKQGFKDARPNIKGKVTYARVFIKRIGG